MIEHLSKPPQSVLSIIRQISRQTFTLAKNLIYHETARCFYKLVGEEGLTFLASFLVWRLSRLPTPLAERSAPRGSQHLFDGRR
jgi:hypothetical protein